jgi:drug/metabolite transporter (DMT)-like permease
VNSYIGEIAALGTACCWSIGSIFFTISSRKIGHHTVNRLRLIVGLILLVITHLVLTGTLWPHGTTLEHWLWFGLSGIIGFAIGDTLLFRSFVLVGPRLAMLMMALVPVFSTLIAWLFLNEVLVIHDIIAIIVTLGGITWVILARPRRNPADKVKDLYAVGLLCGIGGALGQAIGLIFSKKGLMTGFPALSGNILRICVASLVIWAAAAMGRRIHTTIHAMKNKKAFLAMCGGALLGPFLGVWLSLIAVDNTYVGIASTLMALPPVFLIPLSHWVFKEKITLGAIMGTLVTMIGVTLIFLL